MNLSRALRIHPKDVVALTGGGGKTTVMFRLADELVAAGQRVVTTMTTKIFVSQMARAPACLVMHGESALLAQLPEALSEHGHVLVVGGTAVEQDKAAGVPPEFVDRLAAQGPVDAVLVEADGSRRRSFKAPAAHEPVIPASATVVVPIVGLDVLGQPLAAETVHRPELVAGLTGAALGDPVTPELVAAVLAHPAGGAKGLPPGARLIPFLNKAGDPAALAAARRIARRLLAQPIVDSVVIGAAEAAAPVIEVWGRVAAVVLAAGQGRRFGGLKQVMPWRGVPLVAHVADQASACPDVDRVIVTVGAGAEQVRAALAARDVTCAPVPDWAAGQSRSVQAGLRAAQAVTPRSKDGEIAAVLFLLADQPDVSPELLSALIERHRATLAPVVAPRYGDQRGNPVLFDRETFGEFALLAGDIGARPIIQAHAQELAWVTWPTPEIVQDIDVAEDFPLKAENFMKPRPDFAYPVHPLIQKRWSPRAFAPRPVEDEKIMALFEAARWAASGGNEQPWRFICVTSAQAERYGKLLACLNEGNLVWAAAAPVLILTLVKTHHARTGRPNKYAWHDLGLAVGNLTTQASALDLYVHQMGGFSGDKARALFGLPGDIEPATMIAVGYLGDPDQLPDNLKAREITQQQRKPLAELLLEIN